MDPNVTQILVAGIGATTGIVGAYLVQRRERRQAEGKERVDLMQVVDARLNAFIKRLEDEIEHKDAQIDRLEMLVTSQAKLVQRVINALRRFDPDAAAAFEAESS